MPRQHLFQIDYGPHGFRSIPVNLGGDNWDVIKIYARQYASLYLRDNGSFWSAYRQNGSIPLNYVIDTAGIVRYVAEGYNEEAIKQTILQYLPDPIEHDVGVTRLFGPSGSFDSGAVFTPACSLRNFGSYAESYQVRMRIGAGYDQVYSVSNHQPNSLLYVEFPEWTALVRGANAVTCTTELAGDDIGSNNARTATATVNVYDVAVSAILAPADSVDSGVSVVPMAEVRNLGTIPDMAKVHFYVGDFYHDSVNVALQPGRTDTAVLRAWIPVLLGTFPVRCTTATIRTDMVTGNNLLTGDVRVVRFSGVEEGRQPYGNAVQYLPTVVSRSLLVPASMPAVRYTLFDMAGRPAMTLRPGRNDLRHLTPGVYYCRITAPGIDTGRKLTLVD